MGQIGLKWYDVIVAGPEGSGSALVSRIVAHVLGSKDYDLWDGLGKTKEVLHISIPAGVGGARKYVDISQILAHKYVLVSRDQNCSVLSKLSRGYCENADNAVAEMTLARKFLSKMFLQDAFVFSYETFLFYGLSYLKTLYSYLGVHSDFMPEDVYDGNQKYISGS